MIKELLLIHPLGQAAALVFGLFNLITGWTRTCFIRALHINVGVMFYTLTLIGAVMGFLTARRAAHEDIFLFSPLHIWTAAVLIVAVFCGMLSGFVLLCKAGMQTWVHTLHRYCNLLVIILFVFLAMSGMFVLVKAL